MQLRLLGPPELVIGGQSADLGGPRQRAVLSLLALNPNRVIPVDQLLDLLWGDDPPASARGQVQICISALRKLLIGSDSIAIVTKRPGYLLTAAPDQIDVQVFDDRVAAAQAHVAAGRSVEAVVELRAALSLWRGPALAGVSGAALAREATRLTERHAAVLEQRLRLDLALGRHRELIGELRALVAEQPLQEALYALLMLALYRCGRQAEALEVARAARALLAEELGVDPGPEVQEMERAILTADPGLDVGDSVVAAAEAPVVDPPPAGAVPVAVPRQLPLSVADFTGREAELAAITAVLAGDHDAYAMPIVAISGQGGVGKSSLAVRAAHELIEQYPDGQLYADLGDGDGEGQLGRFLRALGVQGSAVPDDPRERAELYRTRLADRRLLVVLDDVDDEDQVLPLLPGSPHCGVILTGRSRSTGLPGAVGVTVDPLDADQMMALLVRIVGADRIAAEPQAAADLAALCSGLPLALRIVGARLVSRPHWRVEDLVRRLTDENRRLDELVHKGLELRSTIAVSYEGLPDRARRLLRLGTLVRATEFSRWAAAAVLDVGLDEADDLLETLVEAQVLEAVTVTGDRVRRYRYHDLIRVFGRERLAEAEPPAEQDAAVARYVGGWLALCDAAHRSEYGGDFTVLHGTASRWVPPDADLPEPIPDALRWWEAERRGLLSAIRQAADAGLDEACWDLSLTSTALFEARCYFDDWLDTATVAAGAAERAGNRRGAAAARYCLGSLALAQKRFDEALAHLCVAAAGFEAVGDRHGRALVLRHLAFVDGVRGERADAQARYTDALEHLRAVGDRIGAAHVLSSLARLRIEDGDTGTARRMLDEAVQICRQVGCLRVEAQVTYRLAELHLRVDDLERARHALHRVLRVVRHLGDRVGEAYALQTLGVLRHREGRLEAADTTLRHAFALAREVTDRWIESQTLLHLGEVALARGDRPAAVGYLEQAAAGFAELDVPHRADLARTLAGSAGASAGASAPGSVLGAVAGAGDQTRHGVDDVDGESAQHVGSGGAQGGEGDPQHGQAPSSAVDPADPTPLNGELRSALPSGLAHG